MQTLPALKNDDYETIEAAVMETARGRWFLHEYARRNRAADTAAILEAVGKLEKSFNASSLPNAQVVSVVSDMIAAFETLAADISSLCHETETRPRQGQELDFLGDAMDAATQQVLAAAEDMQETSWAMRELGKDINFCDRLDRGTNDISLACSVHDISRKRISMVVNTLRQIEKRASVLAGVFGIAPAEKHTIQRAPVVQENHYAQNNKLPAGSGLETPASQFAANFLAVRNIAVTPEIRISSVPDMHEALASEWSADDDDLLMDALQEETINFDLPLRIDFSNYSFEEKLALFS